MYYDTNYPIYFDDNVTEVMEPAKEELEPLQKYISDNRVWEKDIWPYWYTWSILKAVGKVENLQAFNNDNKFADQIREALSFLPPTTVNYVRRLIADRKIGNFFPENIVFGREIDTFLGLPKEIEWGSTAFQIWSNFIQHADKHHIVIRDLINMTNNEHLTRYREMLLRSSGEKRLLEIHEEVVPEYNKIIKLIEAEKLSKPFAEFKWPKPLPPQIKRLSNGLELLEEGQKMHHCVASYVDRCLEKHSYIFHVEEGKDMATLEIDKNGNILQFKSYHNGAVASNLQAIVAEWLSK